MKTEIKKRVVNGQEIIRRRTKSTFQHMPDGVHPDDFLRDKWFRVLVNSINQDIEKYFSVDVTVSVEVQSSSLDED